jgi:hypothetical protein
MKTQKIVFDRLRASAIGRENAPQHIRGVKKFFFSNPPMIGKKKTQNFLLILKIQNALTQKCTYNKLYQKTCHFW